MKICHIFQKDNDIPKDKTDSFAVEDYRGFGSIHKAEAITNQIFLDRWNQEYIRKITYKDYEVSWSVYDIIYRSFSLPFTEIERLIDILNSYEIVILHSVEEKYANVLQHICYNKDFRNERKVNLGKKIKRFFIYLISFFITIPSIFYFAISKKKIGIWTSDMIFQGTDSDFRFNRLYERLKQNKIKFVEFVRIHSLGNVFKNILIRKRLVIYYQPISYFLSFFLSGRQKKIAPKSIYNSVLLSYDYDNQVLLRVIPIFQFIYKLIGLRSLWVLYFSSRNAPLVIAAKASGIKTIGMKHGAGTKSYDIFEFITPYWSTKKLGPDVFGVWSLWYLEYFKKYSKILSQESIKYAGLLRPYTLKSKTIEDNYQTKEKGKIRLLLISEPLTDPREIVPYLEQIINDPRFSLAIKVRPMTRDLFYENIIKLLPIVKSWPKYEGDIFEEGEKADIFIGSHSTALPEASLLGKLSIFLKTEKWGDYFEVRDLVREMDMLVERPEKIIEHIFTRIQKEKELRTIEKIRERYFGENKDGTDWAVRELNIE